MTGYSDNSDYLALLATVCDRPGDDLPRLVLADYLDDRGDRASAARAEFIRVGCELDKRPRVTGDFFYCRAVHLGIAPPTMVSGGRVVTGDPGVNSSTGPTPLCRCANCRLLGREHHLFADHSAKWGAEVSAVPQAAWEERSARAGVVRVDMMARPCPDAWLFQVRTLHYTRGFVSRLTLPAAAFAEFGPALFAAAPVEQITFPDADGLGPVRVVIEPPGSEGRWHAYFYRAGRDTYFDPIGYEHRRELAAGIAAVVAGWPELTAAQ